MNSLTDLRRTLDQHAEGVADPAAVARTAAVHHRIAVVRRRRRAAAAGAVSLVLLAGVGAAVFPRVTRDTLPAAPVVLGEKAPTTMTSLGYTYRTDGHAETFRGAGSVRVTASTRPQLFSWTTDRADDVQVTLPDGHVVHSRSTGFQDFAVIAPGERGKLTVRVDQGRVGLASYDLSDAAPDGYTAEGVTFRKTVAGVPLLAATIPSTGTTDVSATYVAPDGQVGVHLMCAGVPRGDVVNVSFNGQGRISAGAAACDDEHPFDPGAGGASAFHAGRPGSTVSLRVWVSESFRDATPLPSGSAPDVRMGIGVYGPLQHTAVGGYRVDSTVELDGHTWAVAGTRSTSGDLISVRPAPYDRYAAAAWNTHGRTQVRLSSPDPGLPAQGTSAEGGQASMGGLWIPAGAPAVLHLRGEGTLGMALYTRVD